MEIPLSAPPQHTAKPVVGGTTSTSALHTAKSVVAMVTTAVHHEPKCSPAIKAPTKKEGNGKTLKKPTKPGLSKKAAPPKEKTDAEVLSSLSKLESMFEKVMEILPSQPTRIQQQQLCAGHVGTACTAENHGGVPFGGMDVCATDDSTQARGTLHDDHGGSSYSGDECDFPAAAAGYAPAELTGRPVQVPSFAAKFAVSACVGNPINDELANSTNYLISHCLEEKSMEESVANYPAPSNCPNLLVPKVNPVIWDNVTQTTRSRDVKLQRVQKSLTRGLCAFLQTLPTDLNEAQQDALALLCNANYEMNCLRKELIKPDMNAAYAHLCKPTTPVTAFLFGDDLGQRVKDLKEENRAAFSVVKGQAKRSTHQPYHPYKRTASGGFSRKQYRNAGWLAAGDTSRPFLGQQQRGYRHSAPHTQTRPPPAHAHNRGQSYSTATPAKPNTVSRRK
ncbi:uncharacterized protein [Diadema setosum]|uniref:uncharacterized protein n=1 Tax=Diadema setosum TaxID=31175 RepID=UPI003B3B0600